MPRVLIVDDEKNVVYSFRKGLACDAVEIASATDGAEAIRLAAECRPDAVILDVRLPDMSGMEVFDRLRKIDPRLPVIVVTAFATTETAIDAMKRGAFEYLIKPVDIHQLRQLVTKALEQSRMQYVPAVFEDESDQGKHGTADRIVGQCEAMQQVYKSIGRIAPEDVTVLVLGESGTGKELVARAIYQHSDRANRPFLTINCAALPETLLESELFGHERGAFTGADRRRIGKFEQADQGTLFLDELGDMSPATQAKTLRVLQDGRFERVGGSETIQTDVRVIAATNQELEDKIEAGQFRRDLLYRLNGFTVRLPPLRERTADLPLLIDHFLKLSNQQVSNQAARLSPDALALLAAYPWPGNVRELQSVIKYAVVHCVGDVITPESLPDDIIGRQAIAQRERGDDELSGIARRVRRQLAAGEEGVYRRLIDEIDRVAVREALRQADGNQVHASERLGVARTTLRAKISALKLEDES
jgi:two-component system nitrogen regulation response regulator GlnG